jgi:hypothetical protein
MGIVNTRFKSKGEANTEFLCPKSRLQNFSRIVSFLVRSKSLHNGGGLTDHNKLRLIPRQQLVIDVCLTVNGR